MTVAAQADAADVPFLDLADPALSLRSPAVRAAREKSWYARTPYGLAVLRHKEMGRMLNHPSLRQGSHNWPGLNGITTGDVLAVVDDDDPRHRGRRSSPPAQGGDPHSPGEPSKISNQSSASSPTS